MKRPVAVLLMVTAAALAGCTGGEEGDGEGFSIKSPSEPGGMYRFTAGVSADEYRWDLGDRLTTAEGRTVEHAYDFTDGTVTVRLTAITGEEREQFTRQITLGSGENAKPALILESSTNWTVPGEQVTFSGAASTDPDGDTMRFSWNCIRDRDAVYEATPHAHGGGGGVPFATPGSGSGASRLAVGPLPAADLDLGSDLCGAMQTSGPSTAATVTGSFQETGVYQISLIGSDGPNPTISTQFTVYVTDPATKPAARQAFLYEGTLRGGADGTVQGPVGQIGENLGDNTTYDLAIHRFQLPLDAHNLSVAVEQDGGPTTAGAVVFQTTRAGNALHEPTAQTWTESGLKRGAYEVHVILEQGIEVGYTLTVEADLKMAPSLYFA